MPCNLLCECENLFSVSFNNNTMVSGDDLLAKISNKTIGGIAVVILNNLQNWLVTVFTILCIIA